MEQHTRYCCWSTLLWDKLIELGFKEEGSDPPSAGIKRIKRFTKGLALIEDSYNGTYLYMKPTDKKSKRETKYHGMSVNKELLENFATKGEYNGLKYE